MEVARHLVRQDPVRVARTIVRVYLEGKPAFGDQRMKILDQALKAAPGQVWSEIGKGLLRETQSHRIMWDLEESKVLDRVPPGVVIEWIRAKGARGATAVAECVKPSGDELSELVRFLLREHADAVGGALAANFRSGTWWGSEADYLQGKIATATVWQQDEEPALRNWATAVVRSLNEQIAEAKVYEEERDLARGRHRPGK